jgi:sulfur carrier protein
MIFINGQPTDVESGATVTAALERLGIEPGARGIAVAVDGEVVPRSCWTQRELEPDSRVEVLTAIQGG